MDTHLAILFISRFFLILVIEQFMRVFFDTRRTSFPVMALSYLALPIGLNGASLLFLLFDGLPVMPAVMFLEMVLPVVFFYIIALNYEGTRKKRVAAALSIFAIAIAINYALAIAFGAYIRAFGNLVPRQSEAHFLFEMGASFLLAFMAALLLQNLRNIKKNAITLPVVWVSFLTIPLSSIVVVFIVIFAGGIPVPAQVLVICIMLGLSVFVFFLLDRISAASEARLAAVLRARESEGYLAQLRLMQESAEQTMTVRHDMKAHLSAIGGLAAESKPDEISAYIGCLLGGMDAAKPRSDTGNPVFDSVINYKLRNAERDGIKPDIRLRICPDMNIEPSDTAAILGNLLDNALDAVARVDDKKIWLDIEYNNESLFIKAKNAFDGVVKYAEKSSLPVTRKDKGGGHGLRSIQRAVEKYDGLIKITHKDNVFSVTILLYLGGAQKHKK